MSSPINIKKVAELAGVSVASVSRTINGKGGVGEATRQKVLDTCKALNYNPSLTARKLSSGKDVTVAILLSSNDSQLSPYVTLFYNHMLEMLQRKGLVAEIVYHEDVDSVKDKASSCIVLAANENDHRLESLRRQGIPFVNVGKKINGWWVAPDEFMGIRQLTLDLINRGKKRIAFVVAKDTESAEQNSRHQGYTSALESAGLPPHTIEFVGNHFQGMHVCSYFYRNLHLLEEYDALVCNSDEIALGVLEVIKHQPLNVPKDIAVTGFDDLPLVSGELTTIKQNLGHIAEKTIESLELAKKGDEAFGVISQVEVLNRKTS
ncbi:LacI family DNA-binding transcriptional regulator [Vibrio ishigakensis]|uniref:LacI family DNA-binding transcriptional regulator n=1 Tax=Vibrio ishigakensis TaxID=1481914 RepID=UPI0021C2ED49|nr:LacI family DNA-binding transcriptional regulator [Vibrio ishigakensis]